MNDKIRVHQHDGVCIKFKPRDPKTFEQIEHMVWVQDVATQKMETITCAVVLGSGKACRACILEAAAMFHDLGNEMEAFVKEHEEKGT